MTRISTRIPLLIAASVFLCTTFAQESATTNGIDYSTFQNPPAQFRGRTMMDLDLSTVTIPKVQESVRAMAEKQKYGGVFFVATGGNGRHLSADYLKQGSAHLNFSENGIEFLSDDYFKVFGAAVEEAKRDGLSFVLYDDYAYPTGTVGGQIAAKFPQYMAKRLDMIEADGSGPSKLSLSMPKGIYVGAVLMNMDTHERRDVSDRKSADGHVEVTAPAGNWKLMVFYLNQDAVLKIRNPGLVDYLDEDAMKTFLALTYEQYYAHLKPYFGSVIQMAFFDEPTLHWLDGRTWTPSFNRLFTARYGHSPMKDYPALWYDIGPDTAAARNALYGFRAELFSTNFVGRIAQWCQDHGIQGSGHLDQEEVVNPVTTNGDLMKAFQHQGIPGADDIAYLGRSNRGYKVVTSAASNYDKPVVMAETYAAYEKLDNTVVFQTAMDQFAMGISLQLPWQGIDAKVSQVPELNQYTGRLAYLLQHGRHVADIAVLYPIAALQSAYSFKSAALRNEAKLGNDLSLSELAKAQGADWEYAYNGGNPPPEIDYMDIGEVLFRGLRIDYTYLHPEVLVSNTRIQDRRLILNNRENREEYKTLIVPGGDTISVAAARKIEQFYRAGGTIVATSKLPYKSAEFGQDGAVQTAIGAIFGLASADLVNGKVPAGSDGIYLHEDAAGGRAFFLVKPDSRSLQAVLDRAIPVRDVAFAEPMRPLLTGHSYDGALTYIHKVKAGRDIYFFANSSKQAVDTEVILRGKKALAVWNPHNGKQEAAVVTSASKDATRLRLRLAPVTSLFYISQ